MLRFALLLGALSGLCSCASYYSSNGEQLYLHSRNGENIVVPAPLSDSQISHFYDLPSQNQDAKIDISPPKE